MAKQSLAVRTTNVTTGNACAELRTAATQIARVTEIDISMAGPAGGTFGIGFPAAIGITPTSPVTLLNNDANDNVGTANVALAWGTGPTAPASFLARVTMAASTGATASINFPEGIVIPLSKSLVVWNLTTTDVADVTFVVSPAPALSIVATL